MPTLLTPLLKVDKTPGWISSGGGTFSGSSSNVTALATIVVPQQGAMVVGVIAQHGNWIPTLSSKSLVSDQGSVFTELADVRRGIPGQDNGHVILYYCQDPVLGTHNLTANVTASQALSIVCLANFYKNIVGYRSLTTQTSGGSGAAVNLGIASNAGNIPVMALSADPLPAGRNWTTRAAETTQGYRTTGDLPITAVTGTASFTSTSTNHQVAAAGIDLIAA